MSNKDEYVFHINWDDVNKNAFRIGLLAQIEKKFYLLVSEKKTAEGAYDRGFVGIPGFKAGKIYQSEELFDFFKNRILNKNSENPCEELIKNNGKSMVDSFSLEEIPDKLKDKYAQNILDAYSVQKKKERLNKNKNIAKVGNLR